MNNPVFTLPPWKVEQVFTVKTETVDWGLELLNIPQLWRQTKGEGVKVAVLDTGCALNHPDLKDAIVEARDFTGSRSGPSDTLGHGTPVAGIIAARENSTGVIGVAPSCKLLIGKVMDDNGAGSPNFLVKAIEWALAKKADIISMSLGSSHNFPEVARAIKKAATKAILVAAAGNEGPTLDTVCYPGQYPGTIAVGAIDRRQKVLRRSSRGKTVDIVAPGDRILTTYPPKGLARLTGTSMATPLVSGVVALLLSRRRGNSHTASGRADVVRKLKNTAIDLGVHGCDPHSGWGLINPTGLIEEFGPKSIKEVTLTRDDLSASGLAKINGLIGDIIVRIAGC